MVQSIKEQTNSLLPLRAARLPKLTDDVFSLVLREQIIPSDITVNEIFFYRIEPVIYELMDGKVMAQAVEMDTESEWIVATDSKGDRLFSLAGSVNPVMGFNSMIQMLGIKIEDEEVALDFFDLYIKVACGEKFRASVYHNEMLFQSVVMSDFWSRCPNQTNKKSFETWWKRHYMKIKDSLYPPSVKKCDDYFLIKFFNYSNSMIFSNCIKINRKGTVVVDESQQLSR